MRRLVGMRSIPGSPRLPREAVAASLGVSKVSLEQPGMGELDNPPCPCQPKAA